MSHPAGMARRTVSVSISFGDLAVDVEADGVSSPDGVHDLVGQVVRGFNEALAYLRAYGMTTFVEDHASQEDDDDEE